MAPLAPFGGLEWLACTSPTPDKPKKKAAPAPAKPAANVPKKMNHNINLWTQTPPGGLPPPPNYERSLVKTSSPAKKTRSAKRTSRYWKKFYRENEMLLREPWDAKLWAAFSNFIEPAIEPLRSKFWRKQFRKDPERLYDSESDGEDSCFDSGSDTDDSDFVTDPDTESDTDSDNSRSKSERKIWRARQRKEAMKRAERRNRKSSEEDAHSSGSEKHVHFSDTEEDPESILKRNTEFNSKSGSSSPETSEDEEQFQTSPKLELNVSVYHSGGRCQASAPAPKDKQRGNSGAQGSSARANQDKSDKGRNAKSYNHNAQQNQNNKSCTSHNQIQRPNDFLTASNNLVNFFQSLTVPTNLNFQQFQNLARVQHPFASPLTQSLSNFADFDCATCPFCFSKLKFEFKTFYNPFLGHFISMFAANMASTPAQARCIIPQQAQVMVVEHVLENATDPKPNAFFDSRTGTIRVYHGSHYGNPTGSLLPISAEQLVSTLGAAMPGGGFGSFQSGFPVGHGHGFTDIQVARPAFNPVRMTPQYPPTMPGAGMMDPRLATAMLDQTVAYGMAQAQAQAQGYSPYARGMNGMNMGTGNMNGMSGVGMNNLANQMGGMNMNSSEFSSLPFNNRNSSGETFNNSNGGGGSNSNRNFSNNLSNQNGGGGSNNNRNFSNNSSNQNQNGNGNGNGNGNRSNSGGNIGNGNNRNQSRNPSQAGGNNNNRSTKSNSSNVGGGGGGDNWGDNNAADTWGNDNNGTFDPAPAFEDPSAPSAPPSPTLTVLVNLANDGFSSGRVDVVVNDGDENATPTRETFAHIPGAFPDSAKKNNFASSNTNSNNDKKNGSSSDNIVNNANEDDGWDSIAPVNDDKNNNINDDDDWGESNNTSDAPGFIRTDETVMSAGSWKSPENQKENKKNNTNGYNLKQVNNNSGGDSWGDPSAAQTTGGAGGW